MGLFKTDATKIGFIIIAIIFMFGSFCIYDVNRMLNLTSTVIGYFKHTTDVVKINDFEYDITQLLFTNSGANENEYFGEVITDPVEGFDKTKKYAIEINGNNCGYINQNLGYVNANFMNTFYSTNNTVLLTDNLNIKVNFYKDGTKIVLITNNGEKAVKLWSSYIQKNGFKIKIVEDNFNSMIEVDNIPSYTVNLYVGEELYKSITFNALTVNDYELPLVINNATVSFWKDADGNIYDKVPLKNINLYADITTQDNSLAFSFGDEYVFTDDICGESGPASCEHNLDWTIHNNYIIESKEQTFNEKQQQLFDKLHVSYGSLGNFCELLKADITIQNVSIPFNNFDAMWNSSGVNDNRRDIIGFGNCRLGVIDNETVSMFEININIIQQSLTTYIYQIGIAYFTTIYTSDVYKNCINDSNFSLINKENFEKLKNVLANSCLTTDKNISSNLILEIKND